MRPRPEVASQVDCKLRQCGHIGRGGMRLRPHDAHRWTRSSPTAQPSQNGAESSSGSGSSRVATGAGRSVGVGGVAHQASPRSRRAPVGTPSPEVTRDQMAPSTWLVEVPRTWRTASVIRLNPCR